MALTKRITPVGNSAGFIFDKPVLKQVGWEVGTEVEVKVQGESLILTKYRRITPNELTKAIARAKERHGKSLHKLGE